MGWKASLIIIDTPPKVDELYLLENLGCKSVSKADDEPFDSIINPRYRRAYIGYHQNKVIIAIPDIPMTLIEKPGSAEEMALLEMFPGKEICALVLHSVVNLWGFVIIQKGKRIRAKAGADGGTFVEMGEPQEEEKEWLSKSVINAEGKRVYPSDYPGEENEFMQEDAIGEEFVFNIFARYFGERMDVMDEALFEKIFTGYRYGTQKAPTGNSPASNDSKPWWKFW